MIREVSSSRSPVWAANRKNVNHFRGHVWIGGRDNPHHDGLFRCRLQLELLGATASNKHDCKGMNSGKGQGGCNSGDMGCKGKNSGKGKGGCKVS